MRCKDPLSCLRSGRVYIFRKFLVHMLYSGNEFTKSGYLRCLRRFFYENVFWGKGCKIVRMFSFYRHNDIVHRLNCSYKIALVICAVKISLWLIIW